MFINRRSTTIKAPLFLFFFIGFTLTCAPRLLAQGSLTGLPFVTTFHTTEYHAGIQNWAITEDHRGIVYIANNFGLLEFDGVQWQTYRVKNGTKVRSVAIDARGRIYVGCQGDFGYFFPDKTGKLAFVSLADSLEAKYRNFDEAWSTYIDNDKVYFCTFSRIYIYDGKKFAVAEPNSSLDLSFLVNRDLIVNMWDKGLAAVNGLNFNIVNGGEFFRGIGVSGVLPLGAETFLVSTFQEGIYTITRGVVKPWIEAYQDVFREAHVNCVLRLKNGNFALGTQNNGLYIFNSEGKLQMQLTRGRGLENRTVLGLYEDELHNLWVGQNNGIAHVELGSPFTFIGEQSGLPGTGYAAFLDNDNLYLGTNTGLYSRKRNDNSDFKLVDNTRGQVYHIGRYNQDLLLGHHKGAWRISNTGINISPDPGGWVYLIPKSQPGKLIEGTYGGLNLFSLENGHWKFEKKLKGFNESSRVMGEDQAGNLWVTHGYKGAFKIKFNATWDSIEDVKFYGKDKGFPSNLLINVFKIRNELVFASERGVFKYDAATDAFVPDELFKSILSPYAQVWYMQEDAFGNIYFAGYESMGVLRKNGIGEYKLDDNIFNRIRPYLNDDLVNITILQNNEVVFGAKDGFIHYDPVKKNPINTNFKALIRRVSLTTSGDSTIFHGNFSHEGYITDQQNAGDEVSLPYSSNSLHFNFAATSYEGNADRLYQYYLENYENGWSDLGIQTQKEYTNLKEGKYIFHVRARNADGQISSESVFHVSIAPPWYRSILAYILYIVSIIVVLLFGFNILDQKYQREQKILEEKQMQELNQKESEIEKISIKSQEEITRLQNEKLEADLRHMNNELATATMHILNKNEFITGIKNHLNQIIKKNGTEDSKKELVQITRDIENNISADSDWEHFQFHFDRVHGDFTNRFKGTFPGLSPQEIKLSAYLRMNLSTKEIAQLLNISVRGVEISRYRLRKKLQLDRNQNLQDFILNF
jgi:ligand-binding sensor domain-containing protein